MLYNKHFFFVLWKILNMWQQCDLGQMPVVYLSPLDEVKG